MLCTYLGGGPAGRPSAVRNEVGAVKADGHPTLDPKVLADLRTRYDDPVTLGFTHNRHRDWHDGSHPGYTLATWPSLDAPKKLKPNYAPCHRSEAKCSAINTHSPSRAATPWPAYEKEMTPPRIRMIVVSNRAGVLATANYAVIIYGMTPARNMSLRQPSHVTAIIRCAHRDSGGSIIGWGFFLIRLEGQMLLIGSALSFSLPRASLPRLVTLRTLAALLI